MILYGLKTCDTCRKALKSLSNAEFVDVRETGVPDDVMERALEQYYNKLLNTRSTTWRNLPEEERAKDAKTLLKEYPTLMKRPLISVDGALYLGWDKSVQAALGVTS